MKRFAAAAFASLLVLSSVAFAEPLKDPRAEALRELELLRGSVLVIEQIHARQVAGVEKLGVANKALSEQASAVAKAAEACRKSCAGDAQAQLLQATKQMQETQMSFNLQYLQLQSQMQDENRQYAAISKILKTKHDTVKNSISSIR
jgi:hypothetical protein